MEGHQLGIFFAHLENLTGKLGAIVTELRVHSDLMAALREAIVEVTAAVQTLSDDLTPLIVDLDPPGEQAPAPVRKWFERATDEGSNGALPVDDDTGADVTAGLEGTGEIAR